MTRRSCRYLFDSIAMIIAAIVMIHVIIFKILCSILKFIYDRCIEYGVFEKIFISMKEHKKISLCIFLIISIAIGSYSAYITIEKERIVQERHNAEIAKTEKERSEIIGLYNKALSFIKYQKYDEASDYLKKILGNKYANNERLKSAKYLYYYSVANQNKETNPTLSYNYLKLIPDNYSGECADIVIPFRTDYFEKVKNGKIVTKDVLVQMQELLNILDDSIKKEDGSYSDFKIFKLVDENKLIISVTPVWGFQYDWASEGGANRIGDLYEKLLSQMAVPIDFDNFRIEFRDELNNELRVTWDKSRRAVLVK